MLLSRGGSCFSLLNTGRWTWFSKHEDRIADFFFWTQTDQQLWCIQCMLEPLCVRSGHVVEGGRSGKKWEQPVWKPPGSPPCPHACFCQQGVSVLCWCSHKSKYHYPLSLHGGMWHHKMIPGPRGTVTPAVNGTSGVRILNCLLWHPEFITLANSFFNGPLDSPLPTWPLSKMDSRLITFHL